MFGLLPPSSSVTRLIPSAADPHDLGARRGRARERDLVDARMPDEVSADDLPRALDDVDHAGGKPTSAGELGETQRGERRRGVGLQHDRAAGSERGRELPRRHRQRVVPRHDLPRNADRLLQRVEEERAADRIRSSGDRRDRGGVEAEVLDRLVQLRLHGRDRLADVPRLQLGQRLAVRDDRVGERVQQARALRGRRLRPGAAERLASRVDGTVDVVRARATAVRASVSPVAGSVSSRVSGGFDELAADPEAVLRCVAVATAPGL